MSDITIKAADPEAAAAAVRERWVRIGEGLPEARFSDAQIEQLRAVVREEVAAADSLRVEAARDAIAQPRPAIKTDAI